MSLKLSRMKIECALRTGFGVLRFFILGAMVVPRLALAAELNSPIDFKAQNSRWQGKVAKFQCKQYGGLPSQVKSVRFYADDKSSIVDKKLYARFVELRKPIDEEEDFLARANTALILSNAVQKEGIRACILEHLVAIARDNAFIDTEDAQSGGVVRLSSVTPLISYLLLRDSGYIPEAENVNMKIWISKLVERLRVLQGKVTFNNNIDDWTAAALSLGAVALGRRDILDEAVHAVERRSSNITADGVLPREVERGVMAVDYSLFATQALSVTIAVAQANGIDIWESEYGRSLLRMMKRMLEAIENPDSFKAYANTPNALDGSHFDRQSMGWLQIYYEHTRDPAALSVICARRPLYSWRTGGDWVVLFGRPDQCR